MFSYVAAVAVVAEVKLQLRMVRAAGVAVIALNILLKPAFFRERLQLQLVPAVLREL
jgi:hypothetical protein